MTRTVELTSSELEIVMDLAYKAAVRRGYEGDQLNHFVRKFIEGYKEGKAEGAQSQAMDMAKSLLAEGLSEELIMKATGLSLEELKALKD